ncbi:MAG: 50S ribosomal protein L27 [Candidatus Harrisonbacteria bacterium]|nr:50S ribosomal protein L27 [Candidatus Harrisonbacteria bacterium]MBI2604338.1 50S ribosomal protein L27 [Candidatus Harrisonbacteria bacterium]MBI3114387.1 50S ribosomal protein L27 [Candidatus Harrisonbacteria bacterium]
MASTKSTGSTKLGRDSAAQRLGIKKNHGQGVRSGEIIIRQRGTHYLHGEGVRKGADDTLYAVRDGVVQFIPTRKVRFDRNVRTATIVRVILPAQS